MTSTLVDSNVLIDVLSDKRHAFRAWSLSALKTAFEDGPIVVSAIVWAELSGPGTDDGELRQSLAWLRASREDFPFAAARSAGMAHGLYRRRGGGRERTLPDFLIGAHALVRGHILLTRDPTRYRSYFPDLDIVSPETHP